MDDTSLWSVTCKIYARPSKKPNKNKTWTRIKTTLGNSPVHWKSESCHLKITSTLFTTLIHCDFKKKSSNWRSTITSLRKTSYLYSRLSLCLLTCDWGKWTNKSERGGKRAERGRECMNLMHCSKELWQTRHLFEQRLLV